MSEACALLNWRERTGPVEVAGVAEMKFWAVGRKKWLGRDLQIESNIWRDRMQYGFKLYSCRLGFSFANDRLAPEHGQASLLIMRFGLGAFISRTSPFVRLLSGKFVDRHHSKSMRADCHIEERFAQPNTIYQGL
ncbi:hypothetical protein SUGI_0468460 [Cryptomeria japonica]|uniref:uncharacterized protein LOC131042683 n=1 Tax=Cryptomeria japonica TaxID=3369 RepID=UPI002408F1EB|nr:uncharacterized protein LOC131042683 [Cryptomeria japonica]GLJ24517.1 hypothetical protein SUGI_0468460 [Cryptomeria japonica]